MRTPIYELIIFQEQKPNRGKSIWNLSKEPISLLQAACNQSRVCVLKGRSPLPFSGCKPLKKKQSAIRFSAIRTRHTLKCNAKRLLAGNDCGAFSSHTISIHIKISREENRGDEGMRSRKRKGMKPWHVFEVSWERNGYCN